MSARVVRVLANETCVSQLARRFVSQHYASVGRPCSSAMALITPSYKPVFARNMRAGHVPRRGFQTISATSGSVQGIQTSEPAAKSGNRRMGRLSKKEPQSATAQPKAETSGSDTTDPAVQDSKKSKEAAAKKAAVDDILKRINKEMGPNSIVSLDSKQFAEDIERISTGCLTLDCVLGGGIARGRVVEIYGPESCGKTSLAVCIMAQAQKQFPTDQVALMDLESSFDPNYGMRLGLLPERSFIGSPDSGDKCLKMCDQLIASGGFSVLVIDSVSALMPESELERDFGDPQVGSQARLLSSGLRRLTRAAQQYNVSLIFINQLRMKIGVMYGNPETTSGGMALKFYASQRIDVRRKEVLTATGAAKENPAEGIRVRAKVVKNKTAPPGGEAMFDLIYSRGIDKVSSTVDGAVMAGVVEKRVSYFYYHKADGTEVPLGQGKQNVVKMLEQDDELRETIHNEALKKLRDRLGGVEVAPDETSDDESVAGMA